MLECRIRNASIEDINKVYEVEISSFPYPYPIHLFYAFLKLDPELFIVLECDGEVVGYAVAINEGKGYGHIISIAIKPSYRGKGFGKMLMIELERRLRELGVKYIRLEVSVNNNVAIKLYTSLGYKIKKIIRRYYPDGSDAYLMVKEIKN